MNLKPIALVMVAVLTGCGQQQQQGTWLGYAEGDQAFISAPLAGWVKDLRVERGSWVKKGDLLFSLDATNQVAARDQAQAAITQAQANLEQARANLELMRRQFERQQGLMHANATSKQAFDQAKSAYDAAVAQVAQMAAGEQQAHAGLYGAAYQLSQREVVSLTEGRVQDIYFREGEFVPAMTPVVSVLPPQHIYVRFFVPENQFSQIHLGQKVRIHCDGCRDDIVASITFVASQQEFTPPVIFSNQSRAQLVFKAEARAPGGLKLNPGQPVNVDPL